MGPCFDVMLFADFVDGFLLASKKLKFDFGEDSDFVFLWYLMGE